MSYDGGAAAGRVYDLGYQPYLGPRQGRGRAFVTLAIFSLRRIWGIGRPFRSKPIPWGLALVALMPVIATIAFAALEPWRITPLTYQQNLMLIAVLLLLFCAVSAPALLCADQRNRVLSLYFASGIERLDYLAAKIGALVSALLAIVLLSEAILYAGTALIATDPGTYLRHHLDTPPRVLAAALLLSLYYGGIALAIAAFNRRRIFAAGGFLGLLLISQAVTGVIDAALKNETSRYLDLLGLSGVPTKATGWILSERGPGRASLPGPPGYLWLVVALASIALAGGVLIWRYWTVAA